MEFFLNFCFFIEIFIYIYMCILYNYLQIEYPWYCKNSFLYFFVCHTIVFVFVLLVFRFILPFHLYVHFFLLFFFYLKLEKYFYICFCRHLTRFIWPWLRLLSSTSVNRKKNTIIYIWFILYLLFNSCNENSSIWFVKASCNLIPFSFRRRQFKQNTKNIFLNKKTASAFRWILDGNFDAAEWKAIWELGSPNKPNKSRFNRIFPSIKKIYKIILKWF